MKKTFRQLLHALAIVGVVVVTFQISPVFAARPDSFKDTLSDSRPSTGAINTFVDDISSGSQITAGTTITFTWPSGFTFPSDGTWVTGDFSFNDGTARTITSVGASPTCNAGVNNVSVTTTAAARTLVVTACSTYTSGSTGAAFTFVAGVGGTHTITNHATPGSYLISVAGTGGYTDSSQNTDIAIIGGVTLSATISESLTHTTAGANTSSECVAMTGVTEVARIDTSGDATTVPFGTININGFYGACQKLTVSTNAAGGYVTTVQTTSLPTSGPNTIAKGVCDASCTDSTAAAWNTNTNYGYGYCMKDTTGTPAATADGTGWASSHQCNGASPFAKTIANAGGAQTAQNIMKSTAPVNADQTLIHYRITVGPLQQSGSYSTTLVYIDTGTF